MRILPPYWEELDASEDVTSTFRSVKVKATIVTDVALTRINSTDVTSAFRKLRRYSGYVKKRLSYFTIPAFEITDNVWRGASEIVGKFRYTFDNNFSLLAIGEKEAATNCCICISWKPTSDTIVRYKLWEDVGEILYVPLYNGEPVPTEFCLEVWNTNNATINGGGEALYHSVLTKPTGFCPEDDIILGDLGDYCSGDTEFVLEGFDPSSGSYYIVDGHCCGDVVLFTPFVILDPIIESMGVTMSMDTQGAEYALLPIPDFSVFSVGLTGEYFDAIVPSADELENIGSIDFSLTGDYELQDTEADILPEGHEFTLAFSGTYTAVIIIAAIPNDAQSYTIGLTGTLNTVATTPDQTEDQSFSIGLTGTYS